MKCLSMISVVLVASVWLLSLSPVVADLTWLSCASPEDTLRIDSLSYVPQSPKRGENITVTASGELFETVSQGSRIEVSVKWGFIRIPVPAVDVCKELDSLPNAPQKCPIEPGNLSVTQTFALPDIIPNGKFNVNIKVKDQNKRQVTCVNAVLSLES